MSKDEKVTEEIIEEETKKQKPKKEKKLTELELLTKENEDIKAELAEITEKALRAIAELENYKKRVDKATTENVKYYNLQLIEKLLIPLDQLNLVVGIEVESKELNNYLSGFKMINKQIFEVLEEEGLRLIETEDKMFDPTYHYAVETETNKEKENGIILKTRQTGYLFKDRVIRPALVIVNEWSEENGKDK